MSPGLPCDDARHDIGERSRRGDRRLGARLDDRPCDGARVVLFAEHRDDGGKIAFRGVRNHVGGADPFATHAHIQRPVVTERESTLGIVDLHRGHADVEQHAVDRRDAEVARDGIERRELLLHQGEAAARCGDEGGSAGDRRRVAIDGDDARRARRQHEAAVAPGAKRSVDVAAAVANAQEFQRGAGKHGNMTGWSASGTLTGAAAHRHSRAPSASCAALREPSCFLSARTFSVAPASCARKRSGSQI